MRFLELTEGAPQLTFLMQQYKSIRTRRLEVSDFEFVRRLASKQPHFTQPPKYVLWMLSQAHPESCLIAEHIKLGPMAYLLAMPFGSPRQRSLYIWQAASTVRGHRSGAMHVLLLAFRKLTKRIGARAVIFTTVSGSPQHRMIRRYAYSLSGRPPRISRPLPRAVSPNEHEFIIGVPQ